MFRGRGLFVVIILILSLGATGITGQQVMAQAIPSLPTADFFDFTYVQVPLDIKLPFRSRQRDFFVRLLIAPYMVINSPGNIILEAPRFRDWLFKRGCVIGIGFDIYFAPQKSRQRSRKNFKVRVF